MAIEEMDVPPAALDTLGQDRRFLGHPIGLAYLAFTEAWERFSYYGMQTLLVLYMTNRLLLPGHVENIAGFVPFRRALEGAYGPLTLVALSSAIFGLYASMVYLTPILGGVIADRLLGKTRTVILGASLMAAGHFLMAFEYSFLAALLCLVLGVGCFKGNLASQVGGLYKAGDTRTADAFQIYYIAINAGVIISPLICGTLGEKLGWHWGFGAAGVGMVLGLAIYLAGRRHLPRDAVVKRADKVVRPPLAAPQLRAIVLLVALLPVLAVASIGNQEIFNAYLIWGEANYQFNMGGFIVPTSWLITLDSIVSVSFLFISIAFWRWYATRRVEPDEMAKITIGIFLSGIGVLALALGAAGAAASGGKVSLVYALTFHIINSAGFANIFPVSLALYARAAPPALSSTMIGVYYLFLFMANMLVGKLGGLLDKMPAWQFWAMHAGLIFAAGLVFLIARLVFGGLLTPQDQEEGSARTAARSA